MYIRYVVVLKMPWKKELQITNKDAFDVFLQNSDAGATRKRRIMKLTIIGLIILAILVVIGFVFKILFLTKHYAVTNISAISGDHEVLLLIGGKLQNETFTNEIEELGISNCRSLPS